MRGFMAGLPEDFLNVIKPVQVVTALNTVSDTEIGASETTYDRFFLPSLEQEYCVPQAAGIEGDYFPYWKEWLQLSSPQASGSDNANAYHIGYAIENHTSARHCRFRSVDRSGAYQIWNVRTTGGITGYGATDLLGSRPVCVIC